MRRPEFLARQAACPTGLLGRLLGRIMAVETADVNRIAVELLGPQPADRVLEIGFGHGATVGRLAAAVPGGRVAGVDVSEDMLRLASGRNRADIARGRVELRLASGEHLPFPDASFDKVVCVHTLYFWREPDRALLEIRRVLTGAGRLVLAWRHDDDAVRSFPESIYRHHDQEGVRRLLSSAGFGVPRFVERAHGAARLHLAVAPRD